MAINEMSYLILIPLIVALINIILPVILRKILTVGVVVYLAVLTYRQYFGDATEAVLFNTVIFSIDNLSLFILVFIQLLSIIILLFSLKGVKHEFQKAFFVLYPMTIAFSNGAAISVHSFSLIIFWGLTGIMLYLFAIMDNTKEAPDTAKKTMIIVGGSDVFLILGLILIWFVGSQKSWALWTAPIPLDSWITYAAFSCLLITAFAKAGGFPLHSWVPDFAKDAPVESAAFLPAALDKLLGIYLFARITLSIFKLSTLMYLLLITIGALTIITGVMMAMIQHNGRKLLGYHAVSQVGYMIMGVGSGSILAIIGGLFHMINNTIYKTSLFLSLGSVEKQTGSNDLDDLGGLGRSMPLTFFSALVGALAISGIPPFNGFYSKWLIYQGILDAASQQSAGYQLWLLICLILAVFGSALTLASFMKFIHAIFLSRRPEKLAHVHEAPFNQWFATMLLSVLCISFGIFAQELPLKHFILPVMNLSGLHLLGSYNPLWLLGLFGLALIIGLIIYLITRKVRFDEIYLGGMEALEHFRVTGTGFYNEIRNMKPLKSIYNSAEKKYLDVYDLSRRCSLAIAKMFSTIHNGQLLFYNLWLVLGLLILILVAL